MPVRLSNRTQKIISLLSLTFLLYVQYRLIYNTYELKNNQYDIEEKNIINKYYTKSVRNDKVFPGGQKLIDEFIYRNMPTLENLYHNDYQSFKIYKNEICDSIFLQLRHFSNMDSVFRHIVHSNYIENNLEYLLVIENLSITFDGKTYIPLYQANSDSAYLTGSAFQIAKGTVIDGSLKSINKQNQITYLTVSTPSDHSYQISFALYADKPNRALNIFREMLPTFLLSLFSILSVVGIYYSTYLNWLKQKKLADMKSDFLNSITHEFNTPISTILVANKSLQNKEIIADPTNIFPLTEVIKRQTERLQMLIKQALDITLMNKEIIEKENYELNTLLKEIVNDYALKATGQVHFSFKPAAMAFHVPLNRFLFTTMLNNIFDNAVKYNASEKKEILVKTIFADQNFIITIKDNGIGMEKALTEHIFDKFYRGKNELRTSGLGLGLFYVKQTLIVHNWKLKLASEVGLGTKFCIFIPSQPTKTKK